MIQYASFSRPMRRQGVCARCDASCDPVVGCMSCLLDVAASRPDAPNLEGEVFGRYTIGRLLGQGGMGMVYEAVDARLGRTVALKILADDYQTAEQLEREAEIAASLDHEHIVPIYEADEHEGIAYFSMKRIDGGAMPTPAASERKAAEIVLAIAQAVDYAHKHGVLHLDLKPANVLMDKSGRPFVTDFGLATRDTREPSMNLVLAGTPLYMAPEVWLGKPGAASTAVDVWGLGTLLYQLLTGKPPFIASSRDELMKLVTSDEAPALRGVNADLAAVCLHCLQRDPAARYSSVSEIVTDIRRFLAGEPVGVRPRRRQIFLLTHHPLFLLLSYGFYCCFVAVVLPLVAMIDMQSAVTTSTRTEQAMVEATKWMSDVWAKQAADQFRQYAESVEAGSRDARVIAALSGEKSQSPAEVCELLRSEHPWPSTAWFLLNRDGNLVGRAPSKGEGGKWHSFIYRDYYRGAADFARKGRKEAYISRAYRSAIDEDFKIAISMTVYDAASREIGLLVATFPTGAMLGSVTPPRSPQQTYTIAILAERDPVEDPNDLRRVANEGAPGWVFLVQTQLAQGAEVSANFDLPGEHRENSAFTRHVPISGTPFLVFVQIASGKTMADLGQTAYDPTKRPEWLERKF